MKQKPKKNGKKILVEYCHANTHKAFHVGHTRNICLGESICRILEETGNKIIRVNYQGDIGMHVAKTIYGLLNLNKIGLKEPKENKGKWLGLVYAAASNLSKDEKIAEEINIINQKLYAGDKKLVKIWKESRKWSLDYFEKTVYPDFNVKFNRFYFESEVEKDGIKIRYFPEKFNPENKALLGLLRQESVRKILLFLVSNEKSNHDTIVGFVQLSPSTVSWHLKKLESKHIIKSIKKGKNTFYDLLIDKKEILSILINHKESFLDSLVNKTIEMWDI